VDISLNCIFLFFTKIRKVSLVVWIVNVFRNMAPLLVKFQYSKFDANKKCFCMFKAFKSLECTILFFSNFLIKCGPFLLKIEEDLNIDD